MVAIIRLRHVAACSAALLVALVWSSLNAMTITPVVIDMTSIGRESTAAINVWNGEARPLPIEIVVFRLELDENAEQERTLAGDEWLVFPPQALIPPGRTQVFRIQWLGEPELPASQSYIFSVNQLPVQLPEGTSAIQLVYNFAVPVSVAPPAGEPQLRLAELSLQRNEEGVVNPVLLVENSGNVHGYLSGATLDLTLRDASGAEVWSTSLQAREVGNLSGLGLIQPGKRRRFVLPVELPESGTRLEGGIRYVGRR